MTLLYIVIGIITFVLLVGVGLCLLELYFEREIDKII
jgi:hypothetical protein